MMQIKEITSPRYTESGAIDCDVLFEGMEDPLPYTATPDDTAKTGQQIWQELQSGKWGEIAPFTVTLAGVAERQMGRNRPVHCYA